MRNVWRNAYRARLKQYPYAHQNINLTVSSRFHYKHCNRCNYGSDTREKFHQIIACIFCAISHEKMWDFLCAFFSSDFRADFGIAFMIHVQMWWVEFPPTNSEPSVDRLLYNVHACTSHCATDACHCLHPVTRLHFTVRHARVTSCDKGLFDKIEIG